MTEKWLQILKEITLLQCEMRKNGSAPWFRGHSSSKWKLHSTLHRHVNRLITEIGNNLEPKPLLREEYKSLYRGFMSSAWPLLDARERSDWGIVFSMQHYGIPTRLLDWTESFICALYFAHLHHNPNEEAAIFVLDPAKFNKLTIDREALIQIGGDPPPSVFNAECWHPKYQHPEEDLTTIAVVPICMNPRMIAQRSMFTISGDSFDPLEEQPGVSSAIEKIILPPGIFNDVENYLALNGIDAFNFFPDNEGLRMKHEASTKKLINDAKLLYPIPPGKNYPFPLKSQ